MAFGLLPALQLSKTDVLVALKDGGRGGTRSSGARRWSGALIVGQLALTMTLLAATALLWRNFVATTNADVVIDTANLMTARFTLPAPKYDAARRQRFLAEFTDRLSSAPGLAGATLTGSTPFEPMPSRPVAIEGRPAAGNQPLPSVGLVPTDAGYFRTLRLPIVRGRALTDAEAATGASQSWSISISHRPFFPRGTRSARGFASATTPPTTRHRR